MSDVEIRQEALAALRRHKSGWLGLGETLVKINVSKQYEDWGYANLWAYCKEELGLTTMTAKEMMIAYEYIEENEPASLNQFKSNPDAYVPDFHTLATLSKKSDSIGEEKSDKIRDTLFNAEADDVVSAGKEAKDLLAEDNKKEGEEIMNDIRKKTSSIKKRIKKINNDIQNTSSFNNEVLQTSEKLTEMVSQVEV